MKELAEFLMQTFPDAKYASGKREIRMRCRFCGDSKDPNEAHFYIKNVEGEPHFYNCFKCNEHGIFTAKTLRYFNEYNPEIAINLELYNRKIMNLPQNRKLMNELAAYRLYNDFVRDDALSRAKLQYINNRLGLNLSFKDCLDMNIVLNLFDLLNRNHIQSYTRHPNIMEELDQSFIGFLSTDKSFVTLRNLREGKVSKYVDKRYINYNIFNKANNSKRYYTIPTTIDTLSARPIEIHIAEGVFDILSIFYNLRGANRNQAIYSTISGNNYLGQIKSLLLSYGFFNVIAHIYKDNDVPEYKILNLKNALKPIGIPVYIHWNGYAGEKDFGVKPSRINECVQVL